MIKTFGIIGAGNIGLTVARHVLKAGYNVIISNSKGPDSLKQTVLELGIGATAGTAADAANADMVLLALPWSQIGALATLTNWQDKTVIDATNHFISYAPDFKVADTGGKASSEIVAAAIPGAHVVKAFNTLYFKTLGLDPIEGNGKRVIFISGDHADAKKEVRQLIECLRFAVIDLGTLAGGSKLQEPKGALATLNLLKLE